MPCQNFSYFTTGLSQTDYTLASAAVCVCTCKHCILKRKATSQVLKWHLT